MQKVAWCLWVEHLQCQAETLALYLINTEHERLGADKMNLGAA